MCEAMFAGLLEAVRHMPESSNGFALTIATIDIRTKDKCAFVQQWCSNFVEPPANAQQLWG